MKNVHSENKMRCLMVVFVFVLCCAHSFAPAFVKYTNNGANTRSVEVCYRGELRERTYRYISILINETYRRFENFVCIICLHLNKSLMPMYRVCVFRLHFIIFAKLKQMQGWWWWWSLPKVDIHSQREIDDYCLQL